MAASPCSLRRGLRYPRTRIRPASLGTAYDGICSPRNAWDNPGGSICKPTRSGREVDARFACRVGSLDARLGSLIKRLELQIQHGGEFDLRRHIGPDFKTVGTPDSAYIAATVLRLAIPDLGALPIAGKHLAARCISASSVQNLIDQGVDHSGR
jgi:hypothetical protein